MLGVEGVGGGAGALVTAAAVVDASVGERGTEAECSTEGRAG